MESLSLVFSREVSRDLGAEQLCHWQSLNAKDVSGILTEFPKSPGVYKAHSGYGPFNGVNSAIPSFKGVAPQWDSIFVLVHLTTVTQVYFLLLEKHIKSLVILSVKVSSNQLHIPPWAVSVEHAASLGTGRDFAGPGAEFRVPTCSLLLRWANWSQCKIGITTGLTSQGTVRIRST